MSKRVDQRLPVSVLGEMNVLRTAAERTTKDRTHRHSRGNEPSPGFNID
jgi:hypothetical protein